MIVTLPDGQEVDVQMHDDGLHGDLVQVPPIIIPQKRKRDILTAAQEANDNVWGATMIAPSPGLYSAQAYFRYTRLCLSLYTYLLVHVPVADPLRQRLQGRNGSVHAHYAARTPRCPALHLLYGHRHVLIPSYSPPCPCTPVPVSVSVSVT
jgi:hypothetical protein